MLKKVGKESQFKEVYRGTTVEEIEHFRKSKVANKILSTSTDEDAARAHAILKVNGRKRTENEDKPAVLMLVAKENVPFINVNDVVGEYKTEKSEFITQNEKEWIFSPFSEFSDNIELETVSSGGTYFYSTEIKEKSPRKIENLQEIELELKSTAQQIPQIIKEIREIRNKKENANFFIDRYTKNISEIKLEKKVYIQENEISDVEELENKKIELKQKLQELTREYKSEKDEDEKQECMDSAIKLESELDKIEILLKNINQYNEDIDYNKELIEKQKEILKDSKDSELIEKFNKIRIQMRKYMQGICYNAREKVIESIKAEKQNDEIEIVEQNEKEDENNKEKNDEQIVVEYSDSSYEIDKNREFLNIEADEQIQLMNNSVNIFLKKMKTYEELANKLEINLWGDSYKKIESTIVSIKNNIDKFKNEKVNNIENYEQAIEAISECFFSGKREESEKMNKFASEFNDDNCEMLLKEKLNTKINYLLKNESINKVKKQIATLEHEKVGFFGKISGRDKERKLEIEQLKLKEKIIKYATLHENKNVGVHEIKAKILKFKKENNGVLPESLEDINNRIDTCFKTDSKMVIAKAQDENISNFPMLANQIKSNLFTRRKNIKNLTTENEKLKDDLNFAIRENNDESFTEFVEYDEYSTENIPNQIFNKLDKANKRIEKLLGNSNEKNKEIEDTQELF